MIVIEEWYSSQVAFSTNLIYVSLRKQISYKPKKIGFMLAFFRVPCLVSSVPREYSRWCRCVKPSFASKTHIRNSASHMEFLEQEHKKRHVRHMNSSGIAIEDASHVYCSHNSMQDGDWIGCESLLGARCLRLRLSSLSNRNKNKLRKSSCAHKMQTNAQSESYQSFITILAASRVWTCVEFFQSRFW